MAEENKREAYKPSDAATAAIATIVSAMEGLSLQDRAHVRARLGELYFPEAGTTRAARRKLRKERAAAPAPRQQKSAWKTAFEATPEYRAWQDAILPSEDRTSKTDLAYAKAQAAAMKVRAECKARFRGTPPVEREESAKPVAKTPPKEAVSSGKKGKPGKTGRPSGGK